MDPRVEMQDLSNSHDSGAVHELVQDDMFLLHNAASAGQAGSVREILTRNSQLALAVNGEGLSALHLAAANGHLPVVKELLRMGSLLGFLRDNDGRMPIHVAAREGKTRVVEELMDACSESVGARTGGGDTVLHLGVKSNCFEVVKFLVKRLDQDNEVLNSKDEEGNTILHLAVARRQLQVIKLLLSKPGVDVNVVNLKGLTALDLLLDSPSQHGDLLIGEKILAAGGKLACTPPSQRNMSNVRVKDDEDKTSQLNTTPNTLMLVATLIATITFQAGVNPPGGFVQGNEVQGYEVANTTSGLQAGLAVLGEDLVPFLLFDMIGLIASLSIILLLICVVPRRKRFIMGILVWVMWAAVFSTALAFSFAINTIFPNITEIKLFDLSWRVILEIAALSIWGRLIRYLLANHRSMRRKQKLKLTGVMMVVFLGLVFQLLSLPYVITLLSPK